MLLQNRVVKFKQKIIQLCLLFICFTIGGVSAQTEITQEMINAAKSKITEACPVRWQDVSEKLVLPTDASEVIWEDAADRTDFVAYITTVITESGATADPQVLTDDISTVAAECATKRTGLLDLMLIKEPNDIILGMRAVSQELNELVVYTKNGTTQSLAAKSCKQIKLGHADSEDGIYWLDFDGGNTDNAVQAYCNMSVDGGGWTFVAFISGTRNFIDNGGANDASKFFEQPVGVYEVSRIAKDEHYSLGVLPQMDDTEMLVTYDTPEMIDADQNNDFVKFIYAPTAPAFNYGPLPCTPSDFVITKNELDSTTVYGTNSNYYSYFANCDANRWSANIHGWNGVLLRFMHNHTGVEQGGQVGGNDRFEHSAWFYVR